MILSWLLLVCLKTVSNWALRRCLCSTSYNLFAARLENAWQLNTLASLSVARRALLEKFIELWCLALSYVCPCSHQLILAGVYLLFERLWWWEVILIIARVKIIMLLSHHYLRLLSHLLLLLQRLWLAATLICQCQILHLLLLID